MHATKPLILEEIFNSVTHGIGALFSIAGLVILLMTAQHDSLVKLISFSIFGTIFYASKRPFSHTIWHLFVVAGSLCHFMTIVNL